jgi:hypothetical protein
VSARITIDAFVHPCEQAAVRIAAAQLVAQLGADAWTVSVRFIDRFPLAPSAAGRLLVASMLADAIDQATPLAQIESKWRDWLAGVGDLSLFLCTAFRAAHPAPGWAERARRLNRLAAELSREFSAYLVDIDRAFGQLGGRNIRGAERAADEIAGRVLVRCLLEAGLDAIVPPSGLAQARQASPEITVIRERRK